MNWNRKDAMDGQTSKVMFGGREFELKFTSDSKKKANHEAEKYHNRGFHTRVKEITPGVFVVYRRRKTVEHRG